MSEHTQVKSLTPAHSVVKDSLTHQLPKDTSEYTREKSLTPAHSVVKDSLTHQLPKDTKEEFIEIESFTKRSLVLVLYVMKLILHNLRKGKSNHLAGIFQKLFFVLF